MWRNVASTTINKELAHAPLALVMLSEECRLIGDNFLVSPRRLRRLAGLILPAAVEPLNYGLGLAIESDDIIISFKTRDDSEAYYWQGLRDNHRYPNPHKSVVIGLVDPEAWFLTMEQ